MDHLERKVQARFARDLSRIDGELSLIGTEVAFPGGRVDILARKNARDVAIELKAKPYSTQRACAQLLNYLNHFDLAYFVAPKIRYGVYGTLSAHVDAGRLRLFEYDPGLRVTCVRASDLDDARPFNGPEIEPSILDVLYPFPETLADAVVRGAEYLAARDGPYRAHCTTLLAAREKLHKLHEILRR